LTQTDSGLVRRSAKDWGDIAICQIQRLCGGARQRRSHADVGLNTLLTENPRSRKMRYHLQTSLLQRYRGATCPKRAEPHTHSMQGSSADSVLLKRFGLDFSRWGWSTPRCATNPAGALHD